MPHNYYPKEVHAHKPTEPCEKNGACEVKVGKHDFIKINDCDCKVEIDFDLHRCYEGRCDAFSKESFFDNASIECQCFPECPEILYSLL